MAEEKNRIVISAELPDVAREILSGGNFEVLVRASDHHRSAAELIEVFGAADAAITTLNEQMTEEVLAGCPRLRMIANYAVGVNNIDLDAAHRRGIVVTNTPDVLTDATADLTLALILAVTRRVVEGDRLLRDGGFGAWKPLFFLGHSIQEKRLGIVGMGRIGRAVALRAQAFGMEVVYHARSSHLEVEKEIGCPRLPLDELLKSSDVVSIHAPLTAETRHLIDAVALAKMQPGSVLINTARGPVVDETALADALASGHLGGAGLDVFEHEPAVEPRLLTMKNVVLLPHIGSATVETRSAMARIVATDIKRFLEGKKPRHRVLHRRQREQNDEPTEA